MPTSADIQWFKAQFQAGIEPALAGTPLTVDFLTALACQETGHIWPVLRHKGLPVERIAALCVGDTLDEDRGRKAFPRTRAALEAVPRGPEMFAIARQALVDMAEHVPGYAAVARRPSKFCHGFGVFQLDLQFFLEDPDYFLNRDYERFALSLARCVGELKSALAKRGFQGRDALSDEELASVAIVYNTGGFKPAKGLKQGFFDGERYYGEAVLDFLRLAHTVAGPDGTVTLDPVPPGRAIVAPPQPVTATGPLLKVETREAMLRVRNEPRISTPPQANVVGHLPDGHVVRAVTGRTVTGFIEIEASVSGALLRGFASAKFLRPAGDTPEPPVVEPAVTPSATGIVAVTMPRRPGTVTRRRDPASAHSLNEPRQPGRDGRTPAELRAQLAAIADWLAVDDPAHVRYQPRDGLTFCNIYAHDYCHLAGVFLPRVWWSPPAQQRLLAGDAVAPLIGDTIFEVRANDLFRWLRDFGPAFGWRRAGSTSELQSEVNLGAIGLIVARRKEDGRSGHIVAVVPETDEQRARRDAGGEVIAPLQSQAGTTNFRYGTGSRSWWNGEQFAEAAFWLAA
jgi:hypothetical protein